MEADRDDGDTAGEKVIRRWTQGMFRYDPAVPEWREMRQPSSVGFHGPGRAMIRIRIKDSTYALRADARAARLLVRILSDIISSDASRFSTITTVGVESVRALRDRIDRASGDGGVALIVSRPELDLLSLALRHGDDTLYIDTADEALVSEIEDELANALGDESPGRRQ